MGALDIENVGLRFKLRGGGEVTALSNLHMQIPDKQFAVIVGPSGCGKSSLLDLVAGLKEASNGECKVNGTVVRGPGAERGMVFQNYSLFPWLSVQKNVEFGLALRNAPQQERTEKARHFIQAVGLKGFENAYPSHLSGGMTTATPAAAAKPQQRPVAFVVPGAQKEPLDEMPLPQRAKLLEHWLAAHPKPTDANVKHWLYQNEWIVAGAKFGWWRGAEALRMLVAVDKQTQSMWGVGAKSATAATVALGYVVARSKP